MEDLLIVCTSSIGIGISLLLAIVLFWQKKTHHFFLGLIFFAFFLQLSEELLWITALIKQIPQMAEAAECCIFLIAPALYLYAYYQEGNHFRKIDLLHFLPVFLAFLNFTPLYFRAKAFKLCYISDKMEDTWTAACESAFSDCSSSFLGEGIADFFHIIQFVVYLILAIPLLKSLGNNKSKKTSEQYRDWGRMLIFLCVLGIFLVCIDLLLIDSRFDTFSILYLSSTSVFTMVYLLNRSLVLQENLKTNTYLGLAEKESQDILDKIEIHLADEEVYLQPRLTLEQISTKLNIPRNKISHVLNSQGLNLHSLINKMKIDRAKVLLLSPDKQNFTLEAIGEEVGFSSKATFYKYFRMLEGMTPREYQNQMRSDRPN